jgi:hypothetical protein
VKYLYLGKRSEQDTCGHTPLFRMANAMTPQNIGRSSWDILYTYLAGEPSRSTRPRFTSPAMEDQAV